MFKPKSFFETFKSLLESRRDYDRKEVERLLGYALVDGRIIEEKKEPSSDCIYKCLSKFMSLLDIPENKYFYEIDFESNDKFEGFTYLCRGSVYLPTVIYDWKRNKFSINTVAGYTKFYKTRFELKLPLTA